MSETPIEPTPGRAGVTPTGPAKVPGGEIPEEAPAKSFDIEAGKTAETPEAQGMSPLDLQQQQQIAQEVSPLSLNQQGQALEGKVAHLAGQLNEENFQKLTPGQKNLLLTKTGQFTKQMQGVAKSLGEKYDAPEIDPKKGGSLNNIVKWLTDASGVLKSGGGVGQLAGSKKISVSDMLRVQANMMAADRTINFASAVVGKFTSAITELGRTQI